MSIQPNTGDYHINLLLHPHELGNPPCWRIRQTNLGKTPEWMTLMRDKDRSNAVSAEDLAAQAVMAGLVYVSDNEPGIRRIRRGSLSITLGRMKKHSPIKPSWSALPGWQYRRHITTYGFA
jgi:hypothetical protein